jgi:hypothetical protein
MMGFAKVLVKPFGPLHVYVPVELIELKFNIGSSLIVLPSQIEPFAELRFVNLIPDIVEAVF